MRRDDLIVGGIAIVMMAVVCAATLLTYEAAHAGVFEAVSDKAASFTVDRDESVRYEQLATLHGGQGENAPVEPQEATDSPIDDEAEYLPAYEAIGAYVGPLAVMGDPDGLNSFDGVYEFNGATERFYSSRVLVHEDIGQWWNDDDGFWRTEDGYYVVASDDHPKGAVIETSQGQAMVLDDGCGSGTVDVYTSW